MIIHSRKVSMNISLLTFREFLCRRNVVRFTSSTLPQLRRLIRSAKSPDNEAKGRREEKRRACLATNFPGQWESQLRRELARAFNGRTVKFSQRFTLVCSPVYIYISTLVKEMVERRSLKRPANVISWVWAGRGF